MANIPRLKKRSGRVNINVMIDQKINEIYRTAKQNGYDAPEIARKAVEEAFIKIEESIKKPA